MTNKMLYQDLLTTGYIFFQFGNKIKIIKKYFGMLFAQFNKISNHSNKYIDVSVLEKLYLLVKNSKNSNAKKIV